MVRDVGPIELEEGLVVAIEDEPVVKSISILCEDIEECIMDDVGDAHYDEIMEFIIVLDHLWVWEIFWIGIWNFLPCLGYELVLLLLVGGAVDEPE